MQVAAHVDAVGDRGLHPLQCATGVVDATGVVGGGDAVLGDVDRHAAVALPRPTDAELDRAGVVLPAGEGAFGRGRNLERAVRADLRARVGLDADPVVTAGGVHEHVLPAVAVVVGHLLGTRFGLVGLRRDRPAGALARPAQDLGRPAVAGDEVLGHERVAGRQPDVREGLVGVGHDRDHVRLVDRADETDTVEDRQGAFGEAGEAVDHGRVAPVAVARQPGGVGEVVERDHRGQPEVEGRADHPPVVVEQGSREVALLGLDPRPLDPEPVAREPRVGKEAHVLRVPVVAVRGVAARRLDRARRWGESMLALPPVARDVVALYLVRGRRGTPEEAIGKAHAFSLRWGAGEGHLMPVRAMPWMK